jgi:hypothetical protein
MEFQEFISWLLAFTLFFTVLGLILWRVVISHSSTPMDIAGGLGNNPIDGGAGSGTDITSPVDSGVGLGKCDAECSVCECQLDLRVKGTPTMSIDQINALLEAKGSDAKGTGQTFYDESVKTGIDDVFAMAFFNMESNYATNPKATIARETKSMGHISSGGCPGGPTVGNFCKYATWDDGIRAWYNLILKDPNYFTAGRYTLGAVVCRYAPSSQNNVALYVQTVRDYAARYGRSDALTTCSTKP